MDAFPDSDGRSILLALVTTVQENAAYLSELDGAIGDGDHGVNMNRGFTLFLNQAGDAPMALSTGLALLGTTLLTEIGGAMGPLYGTLFMAMSDACQGETYINADVFARMLIAGVKDVQELGGASVGDKTLMDVLLPAQSAFSDAIQNGAGFSEALATMIEAARSGQESTRDMVARVGRASRLAGRSQGHLDAGATSCYLLLAAMADEISRKLHAV